MGEWARPNDFFVACRLTSSKYADSFLDTGSIKFNTPQSWIDYSKKYGNGRWDGYEGTLAFCDSFDFERMSELTGKYESSCVLNPNTRPLHKEIREGRLFLKDKRSLKLPCFWVLCTYWKTACFLVLIVRGNIGYPRKSQLHISETSRIIYFRKKLKATIRRPTGIDNYF